MNRWLTLLLISLLSSLIWLQYHRSSQLDRVQLDEQRLDYFVHNLNSREFNAQGQLLHQLQSLELKHYSPQNETQLKQPDFAIWQQDQRIWQIKAQKGLWQHQQTLLYLQDQVHIQQLPETMQLKTDHLWLYPDHDYAETDAPIRLEQQHHWLQAIGMRAWLRVPEKIQFLKQTRAYYAVDTDNHQPL